MSNLMASAVIWILTASGWTDGAGVALPEGPVALQQSGNGVASGAGFQFGSRQPGNVLTLPVSSRTGSLSSGSRISYSGPVRCCDASRPG